MALERTKMEMGTPELRLAREMRTPILFPYPGPHVEETVLVSLQCSRPPKGGPSSPFFLPKADEGNPSKTSMPPEAGWHSASTASFGVTSSDRGISA